MTEALPDRTPTGVAIDGEAVRARRKLLGHTITDLAPMAEVSIGYLSQIERGTRPTVSPRVFKRLADVLGLKPEKIMQRRRSAA